VISAAGAQPSNTVYYTLAGRVVQALTGEDWRGALDAARELRLHRVRATVDGKRLFPETIIDEMRREHSTREPNGSLRIIRGFHFLRATP